MNKEHMRECLQCGKEYEFCLICGDYFTNNFSYRVAYCSPECYQEVEKKIMGISDEEAYFVKETIEEKVSEETIDTVVKK